MQNRSYAASHLLNTLRRLLSLVGLGILCAFMGTQAHAVGLEKLVMPGRVIEGHAEVEGDCAACHDVQSDLPQAALCISCHTEVGDDREAKSGFHGLFTAARQNECVICHTDHEGRDADIVPVDAGIFDHAFTDFPLHGAHLSVSCGDCHDDGQAHRDAPADCNDCHSEDDVHNRTLGTACQDCHTTDVWRETRFDHAETAFELTGKHVETACVDCHRGNQFEGTPSTCLSCHAVDDVHAGSNGADCQSCHSTSTWKQIGFNHLLETGFALSEGHGGLACQDCHTREDFKDGLDGSCQACHQSEDDHQGRNGTDCQNCHSATQWHETQFDHDDTDFSLIGAHAPLHCSACHKQESAADTPTDCGSCHGMDDSHGGQLGDDCGSCHQQTEWLAAIAFDHDLSAYPLTGMHAVAPCAACHESNRFHDTPSDCNSCHADDDVHGGSLGEDCASCHTSNQWTSTVFDHDKQTAFPLEGAHQDAPCMACHRDAGANAADVPSTCGGCHKTDDAHDGQFGLQCGQCHNSVDFSDVEQL